MMDVCNTGLVAQCRDHVFGAQRIGRGKHQDPRHLRQFGRGLPKDVSGNQQRGQRVHPSPAEQDHQRARHNHGNRPQGIGHIVQKGRADVHAGFRCAKGQRGGAQIHQQGDASDDHHDPARHGFGIGKAHRGLIDQIQADHDQGGIVDQRRHRLDPAVAKGHICIGWTAGDLACGKGDDQRDGVAEVMQRIGDQRQAARDDPADDLRDREAEVDRHREGNLAVATVGIDVMVMTV